MPRTAGGWSPCVPLKSGRRWAPPRSRAGRSPHDGTCPTSTPPPRACQSSAPRRARASDRRGDGAWPAGAEPASLSLMLAAKESPPPFSPEVRRQLVAWLSHPSDRMELLGGELRERAMAKGPHGAAQGLLFAQLCHLHGPEEGGPGGGTGPGRWWL